MSQSIWGIAIAILCTTGLRAQGSLSGPSLGFVYDSESKAIRPIRGIPGAATLGAGLDLGSTVVKAVVSPQQDFVLGFSDAPALLGVRFDNGTGAFSVDANPDLSTVPDLIAISPSGQAAALFYRQVSQIQVLTGLPKSLAVSATIDISGLPNSLDTLAIPDDGQYVLAGFPENTMPGSQSGEVFLIPSDGSAPRSILTLGHAAFISLLNPALSNPTRDGLVADDAQNALYRIADLQGAATVIQVFGADAQIAAPSAVVPSADNQKLVVAGKSGQVAILDANGGPPVILQCSCTPTGLHRLKTPTSFQLTESVDGLIWMLDLDPSNPDNPRFLFVPPAPAITPTNP